MLEKVSLFAGLPAAEIESVERVSIKKSYKKHTIILDQGDETSSLYVILSGSIKVFLADENGKEIVLSNMGPGEYFGELALMGETQRSASVMTQEDSQFAVISKSALKTCLANNPDMAFNIINGLMNRISYLTHKVSDLGLRDVYGRVASLLQQRAQNAAGEQITCKMTQQDIANEVGSSREMVSRIFKDLKTGGYISIEGGRITLLKKLPPKW